MTARRPGRPRIVLALTLACALLPLAEAPADADDTVGVVVTGEANMQPQLVAQLETWLRAHGHDLVSAPLPPDAINALIDCFVLEDQPCARKVVDLRAKTTAVVFAQVTAASGAAASERTVTLTAYWITKGKAAKTERRTCERCNDSKMRTTADELMATLAGAASDGGRVKLTSTPPGATVRVGGKAIGKTPLLHSLPAGEHELVFDLEDRPLETRTVSVPRGGMATLDVKLGPRPPQPSKLPGYATLAGGVLLAAAGGVLFALDEDVPPIVTGMEQPPTYRDTAPAGVALAATGAVAIGVGVYLLVRKPAPRRAPAVSLLPGGGGTIGWTGRF